MSLQSILDDIESYFGIRKLDQNIYGYQIQPFTKWMPGCSKADIHELSKEGIQLNQDILELLSCTIGLDKEQVNFNSGGKTGVISYNRGWELTIKNIIYYINGDGYKDLEEVRSILYKDFDIDFNENYLIPIFAHRFIVTPKNDNRNDIVIYSVYYNDAIVYATSLSQYLRKEFV